MKALFLDESGDHSLSVIDPQYPMFVLGGIIVDLDYAAEEMADKVKEFKTRLFGTNDLILHTSDIARNKNGFERLKDSTFRQHFYDELNSLMRGLDYKVVACAIRKDDHLTKYGAWALDPYLLSLDILVERFIFELGQGFDRGVIVAETRNPTLDRQLELAWDNLKVQGTQYLRAVQVARRIQELALRDKADNISGLQLADLIVSPVGRFVLGKKTHEDFRIIESKFRQDTEGNYKGRGLIVLPKK